jgi:hypothetical protein
MIIYIPTVAPKQIEDCPIQINGLEENKEGNITYVFAANPIPKIMWKIDDKYFTEGEFTNKYEVKEVQPLVISVLSYAR